MNAVSVPERAPALPEALYRDAAICERLLALHLSEAVQRLGSAALDVVDLPRLGPYSLEPAQIRVAAALFWLSEIERAGLPEFVEAMAEAMFTGRLELMLPPELAAKLAELHADRHERFTRDEREAIYTRSFGPSFAGAFERLIDALLELSRSETRNRGASLRVRASSAARDLGHELTRHTGGIVPFAAREMLSHVQRTFGLLGEGALLSALGVRSPWDAVRRHSPGLLARDVEPLPHLMRGKAGRDVMVWVANNAAFLEDASTGLEVRTAPVEAAEMWRAYAPS